MYDDLLLPLGFAGVVIAALFAIALRVRGTREREVATGGAILASPVVVALAFIVPVILLYLALDWLGAVAGGVGRMLMSVIN